MRSRLLQVRVSDDELSALQSEAQSQDRPVAWVVRRRLFGGGHPLVADVSAEIDPASIAGVSKGMPKPPFRVGEYRDIVMTSGGKNSKAAAKYRLEHGPEPQIDPDSQVSEDEYDG